MALGTPYVGLERYLDLLQYLRVLVTQWPSFGLQVEVMNQIGIADSQRRVKIANFDLTLDDFLLEV